MVLLTDADALYYGTSSISRVYLGDTQKWPASGPTSGDPSLTLGTEVAWTSGTYFDSWTSRSGVTTTDIASYDTNNLVWQLFYAHKAIRISVGSNRVGINPRLNGTNTITLRAAVSSANNTIGSFTGENSYGSTGGSYQSGVLREFATTTLLSIPANRYFLLGIVNGPFYRTFKTLATNRTAVVSNEAVVTVVNKFWWPGWPSGPTTGIPTQLGGSTAGYTERSGFVPVTSFKFEIV
jgi:hypothetical protein